MAALKHAALFNRFGLRIISNDRILTEVEHEGQSYVGIPAGVNFELEVSVPAELEWMCAPSVDGLNVLDRRRSAPMDSKGYIMRKKNAEYGFHPSKNYVDGQFVRRRIRGYRISATEVDLFRTSHVLDSVAAARGQADNTGVIGCAFIFGVCGESRELARPPEDDRSGLERCESVGTAAGARVTDVVRNTDFNRLFVVGTVQIFYDDPQVLRSRGIMVPNF